MATGTSNSRYLENKILNWIKGTAFGAAPTNIYVALYTAAPSDTGGGSEVSGGSYARTVVTFGAITNPGATGGQIANDIAVAFPTPTANWGTITHVGIFDASSGGNLLMWGALTTPVVVNNGMSPPFTFAIGSLVLEQD